MTEEISKNYNGNAVAKNIVFNLLGYGAPLVVAVVIIPPLIKGLGEERFGYFKFGLGYYWLF